MAIENNRDYRKEVERLEKTKEYIEEVLEKSVKNKEVCSRI
ncbi:hypothetical protein [Alkalihalobacillus deserti]|nr:hypothetical protein [Alkalihalobacillus deserti]